MHTLTRFGALISAAGLITACGGGDSGSGDSSSSTTVPATATDNPGVSSSDSGVSDSNSATDTPTTGGSVSDSASTTAQVGSSDDTGSGVKFDVGGNDTTTGIPTGGPGSCRPSEIFGASGGFPAFTAPEFSNFLGKDILIMTSNAQEDGFVLHVLDISGPTPTPNLNYDAPKYHDPAWQQGNLGRIFGLTLDSDGNIYVAPSTVYGANPAPATIKRIDGKTGQITDFATLPNNGPAYGNLNYDCVSQTLRASNHEDGRIWQMNMKGEVISTYHHVKGITMGPAADPGEPDGQFAPLGERIWGIQSHAERLYYSIWWEDSGRQAANNSNEIWSVAYSDETGIPDPATKRLEISVLGTDNNPNFSNPVSDLSFANTGWMLLSQRTMVGDSQTSAHQSTTYEYDYNPATMVWESKGTTYLVGELVGSNAGGVDHDFAEGGYVWMSGDALDFYTPNVVYGVQGTPHGGGSIENSTLIDLDGEITSQDKTALGDVEIPIPGDAKPVPPPG
jgi:hypothetical protein